MSEFSPQLSRMQIEKTLRRDYTPFINTISRSLRLDETQKSTLKDVGPSIWLPWTVSNLSGDEMVIGIPSDLKLIRDLSYDAKELLGKEVEIEAGTFFDFRQGLLAQKTNTLFAKKDYGSRDKLEKLSQGCAYFLGTLGALLDVTSQFWISNFPSSPQTIIKPDKEKTVIKIMTEGIEDIPIEGKADTVVTFGPGLSANQFVMASLGRVNEMHLVSGGVSAAFINSFAKRQLEISAAGLEDIRKRGELGEMTPVGVDPNSIKIPETFFYDEGIAHSIGTIASRSAEVDIAVMSAVHSAGQAECEVGVEGAHKLLKNGGLLVIKAPRTSLGNEGGMDRVASKAIRFFGSPIAAGECGTLLQAIDPNSPSDRPADYAVFQKI